MSPTAAADDIKNAFLEELRSQGAPVETMGELAAEASSTTTQRLFLALGQQAREVYRVPGVGFINLHIKSKPPGWWNILKTVKKDLDDLTGWTGIRSFYVLLVGRNDPHIANGYIATDFLSLPFKRHPEAEATKYTVNEK
jgi:hypothetical protein